MGFMDAVKSVVKQVAVAYMLLLLALLVFQENLVFAGSMGSGELPASLPSHVEIIQLSRPLPCVEGVHAADAVDVVDFRVVVQHTPQPSAVVLFFGGNGEGMSHLLWRCQQLGQYGVVVVAPEPPGYGQSAGPMGVVHSMQVAEITAKYAKAYAQERSLEVIAIGSSIGTFSAMHLAAEGWVQKMLLHAPLTSMLEVSASLYWYVPVGLCLRESLRFDNRAKVAQLRERLDAGGGPSPSVMVIHGDADEIVPFSSGLRIQAALGDVHSRFVRAEGFGHNSVPLDRTGPFGELIRSHLLA